MTQPIKAAASEEEAVVPTYDIASAVTEHADKVLRASGSGLRNYTMPATRRAILSAMMDAIEEAYRAGAAFASERYETANGEQA